MGKADKRRQSQLCIDEVNRSHHWHAHHTPNRCTAWVEEHKEECIKKLRKILIRGFVQAPPKVSKRWDPSAQKWREVSEPRQWPDQYVHHALIQVVLVGTLLPVAVLPLTGIAKLFVETLVPRPGHHGEGGQELCQRLRRRGDLLKVAHVPSAPFRSGLSPALRPLRSNDC